MKVSRRRFSSRILTAALAGSGGCFGLSLIANAADLSQGGPDDLGIQEIVVTAQRREQRLQDVPVAVSVVSGTALENAYIKTLEEVSTLASNVNISSTPLVDQINIRGVGSGQNAGFEQSVATFEDGIYRSRSKSTLAALFDVDRVEILKGPQTTFFGANAIAGALNITTRKPGDVFEYNGSALYGSQGQFNVQGGVTLPASETLSFRVAARVSGMNGYVATPQGEGPHDRSEQGRASVRWEPNDDFRSDFRADVGHSSTNNAFPYQTTNCLPAAPYPQAGTACARYLALGGAPAGSSLNYGSDSPPSNSHYDFTEEAWTNSLKLGKGSLTAITGYFDHKYQSLLQPIPLTIAGTVNGYDPLPVNLYESYHQLSQEIRYQSETGGLVEYMVGGYYSQSNLNNFNVVGFYFLPFGAFAPPVFGTTAATPVTGLPSLVEHDSTWSGFGSLTIRPTDEFRINLGARFSAIHKSAVHSSQLGTTTSPSADPSSFVPFPSLATQQFFASVLGADLGNYAHPTRTDSKFMPSVGLQYDMTRDVMAYATFSKGFKAGGYSAASLANDYGPEDVNAYEIGVKSSLFDHRLLLDLAVFRSNYKDLQESTIVAGPAGTIISLITNAAASRSQGVEIGTSYRINRNFSLNADFAYLQAVYENYPNGACTTLQNLQPNCVQDLSGKTRGYAPKWNGNIGANYGIEAGDYQVHVTPSIYLTSWFFETATADSMLRQAGYGKLDLVVGFGPSSNRWEVSFIGKNLNGKTTSVYGQNVSASAGSIAALVDPPRSYAVQFSIKN